MKRILFCLIALPLITCSQSFKKGNIFLGANADLGFYNTLGKDLVTQIEKPDHAISSIIPVGLEYGLSNHLGVGAEVRINNYLGNRDTATAKNNDFSLLANFHFLRTEFFNMQIGVKYGISDFHYENKITKSVFDAKGGQFQLNLGANLFVGQHFGFQFHAAYNNLHYGRGTIKDIQGNRSDYRLLLNGADIGAGILIKL